MLKKVVLKKAGQKKLLTTVQVRLAVLQQMLADSKKGEAEAK